MKFSANSLIMATVKKAKKVKRKSNDRLYPEQLTRKNMPDVLVMLREEHAYLTSLLDLLEEKSQTLAGGGTIEFQIMHDMLHYLVHYPDEFHHPREEILFDRLLKRDAGSEDLITDLQNGHELIHEVSGELFQRVADILDGDAGAADGLSKRLDYFIKGYRHHMALEDTEVLPRAISHLEPRDWVAINTTGRYVDDPLFGSRVAGEYRQLADFMLDRMELVKRDFALAEMFGVEMAIEGVATLSKAGYQLSSTMTRCFRNSWDQNLGELRERVRKPDLAATACLPFTLMKNNWKQLETGRNEVADILIKTGEDLRKPYQSRMDYLKDMLKHDWT